MSTGSPKDVTLEGRGLKFALVAARWNGEITDAMLQGAKAALETRGAEVAVHRCAGAFELAPLCARVARAGGIDGIVAIGCLIRGGTDHYALLAGETTRALGLLAMELATGPHAVAVAFGVLTCENLAQAQERADVKRLDKGGEVALACLEQVHALRAAEGGAQRARAGFGAGREG